MVNRALEMAMSDPKGPSYLMAAREVLEEVRLFLASNYKILLTECFPSAWKENGLRKSYSVQLHQVHWPKQVTVIYFSVSLTQSH